MSPEEIDLMKSKIGNYFRANRMVNRMVYQNFFHILNQFPHAHFRYDTESTGSQLKDEMIDNLIEAAESEFIAQPYKHLVQEKNKKNESYESHEERLNKLTDMDRIFKEVTGDVAFF